MSGKPATTARSTRRLRRAAILAVLVPAGFSSGAPPVYTVELIQDQSMGAWVVELNDAGWAATRTLTGVSSWVHVPGLGLQTLPPLSGASDARANDINEAGLVVGTSGGQPVFWDHVGGVYGSPTALPILSGYAAGTATAVNDAGDIVGLSTNGQFQRPTLFTGPAAPVDLVDLGGFWPVPAAINELRQVVGHDLVLDLDSAALTNVGTPDAPPSFLWTVNFDINDLGQTCGYALIATGLPDDHLPARWTPDAGWDLVTSFATPFAAAVSINELGDTGLSYFKLVSIEGAGLFAPGDLLAGAESGWDFGSGLAIEFSLRVNDRRQLITRAGNDELGTGGVVIMTPTVLSGDVDGDGDRDFDDLLAVLASWGTSDPAADGTMDGVVSFADLLLVLSNWG